MAKQLVGKEFIDLDESWRSEPGATPTWGRIIRNELYYDDETRKYSYYDAATGKEVVLSKGKLDILTASPNFTLEPNYKIGDTGIEPVPGGYDASETFLEGLLAEEMPVAPKMVNRGGQIWINPETGKGKKDPVTGEWIRYTVTEDPASQDGYTIDESKRFADKPTTGVRQPGYIHETDPWQIEKEIEKEMFDLEPERHEAALAAARQEELKQMQLKGWAVPLAISALAGAGGLIGSLRDNPLDKYVAEVKAEELGKPLIPAEEMAIAQETAKMMSAGARAAAGESRMRQESVQAAKGVQTSAADDKRARGEEARRIDEGLAAAGREKGRLLAGFLAKGRKRKEKILRNVAKYEGFRAMQKRGAVSAFGTEFGKVAGPIFAQMPAQDPGLVDPLGEIAKDSGRLLQPEEYAEISRALRRPGGMTDSEIKVILEGYDLEATDEAVSSLTRRV